MEPGGVDRERFTENGYLGPIRLVTPESCRAFLAAIGNSQEPAPLTWHKGRAANSSIYYQFATQPAIIDVVSSLLGDDVMLWGASLVDRSPRMTHPWHSDIESCGTIGRSVSVWIGLENTTRESSLQLMRGSHRLGVSVQQVRKELGVRREDATNEDVMRWARERDAGSGLDVLDMGDGDGVFFDGRLWHGSNNLSERTRRAVLLQYSTPDTPIRVPDPQVLDWPFRQFDRPRPPCVMVRGFDSGGVNWMVRVPAELTERDQPRLAAAIHRLRLPLPAAENGGWRPRPFLGGSTAGVQKIAYHVSTLGRGCRPHVIQRHPEEELKLVLRGEIDLILPDRAGAEAGTRVRLAAGEFVYLPSHFGHTLEGVSAEPANYLVMKWYSCATDSTDVLAYGKYRAFDADGRGTDRVILNGETDCLQRLTFSVRSIGPGESYAGDVAADRTVVVVDGGLETSEGPVRPFDLIFLPAGEARPMRNACGRSTRAIEIMFRGCKILEPAMRGAGKEMAGVIEAAVPRRGGIGRLWRLVRRRDEKQTTRA